MFEISVLMYDHLFSVQDASDGDPSTIPVDPDPHKQGPKAGGIRCAPRSNDPCAARAASKNMEVDDTTAEKHHLSDPDVRYSSLE